MKKAYRREIIRRYDISKLNNEAAQIQYEKLVHEKSAEVMDENNSTVEQKWKSIKNVYTSVAEKVLGLKMKKRLLRG